MSPNPWKGPGQFLRWLAVFLLSTGLVAAPLPEPEIDAWMRLESVLAAQIEEILENLAPSPDLDRYRIEYETAMADHEAHQIPDAVLRDYLARAPLVLLADTHDVAESQQHTREVLALMAAGEEQATLVIEWIDRSYQAAVDAYLSGKSSLKALRKTVRFDETWGFSWESYSPILSTAKELGVRVLLVESLIEHHSLSRRDRDIAAFVAADLAERPGMRYLVVYGGYHLAGRDHLTDRFFEQGFEDPLVMVDEAPAYYWTALREVKDPERINFLWLDDGLLYIRNGTPVERLRSERDTYLDLLGWDEDDLDTEIDDIFPSSPRAAKFHRLHVPGN